MPFDKHPTGNTPKPFTPTLSANFRSTKSPLTPRLAGSAPTSPAITQRKDFSTRNATVTRDENTTPLSSNVTPRSNARRSRTGTESPAIQGGRTFQERSPELTNEHGLTIPSPKAYTFSPSPAVLQRQLSGAKSMVNVTHQTSPQTQFFRADEVKSAISLPLTNEVRPKINPSDGNEKFFRADDLPPTRPSLRTHQRPTSSGHSSAVSQITTNGLPSGAAPLSAPVSDTSVDRAPEFASRSSATIGNIPNIRSFETVASGHMSPIGRAGDNVPRSPVKVATPTGSTSSPQRPKLTSVHTSSFSRRSSIGEKTVGGPGPGHRKSMSTSAISTIPVRRSSRAYDKNTSSGLNHTADNQFYPLPMSDVQLVSSPLRTSPQSFVPADAVLSRTDYFQPMESFPPPLASPKLDGAANARRERKVLDLEISNSSLLAINKTLERELRKQSMELRRFRRLSQSGRLSIVSAERNTSAKPNSSLGTLSEQDDEELESISDEDEEEDVEEGDESLLSESSSPPDSETHARQRARDEKRLMLDLTKHREMLLDSQKLSQSIRRCLASTEELIRDGNKALQYRVGIGDLKLGGRVLTHDDELDHVEFRSLDWADPAAVLPTS